MDMIGTYVDIAKSAELAERQSAARGLTCKQVAQAFGEELASVTSWIYFVQPGDEPFVKIGYARDIGRRLCSMRTDNHRALRVLVLFQGTKDSEERLHLRFKEHRARGEWFRLEGTLAETIRMVREKADPHMVSSWDEMTGRT